MRDLLFIAHRIPFPPDKGEKIRSLNVIKHLSNRYRVHLGCLTAEPWETALLPELGAWCADVAGFEMDRRRQKLLALLRARPGRPLMLDYYRHKKLRHWVRSKVARTRMDLVYISTVAMMPYLDGLHRPGMILDAQDIDSEKWTAYAQGASLPMRHVWSREGRTLLAYERKSAMACDATLFVSPQEKARFSALAPESAGRVFAVENGVDLSYFSPAIAHETPFTGPGPHLVFTGNMDYWPNAEAVAWFAAEVLPKLRASRHGLQFHIVGANPGPDVSRLGSQPGIRITGRVPDVRPYVAHADVCVAPLRIARGIQNKVLEAMAMARPAVASPQAFEGVCATPGEHLLVADGSDDMALAINAVLDGKHQGLGQAAREAVERRYAWSATLARLDAILDAVQPQPN